jgi:cellobiose phosphorylase
LVRSGPPRCIVAGRPDVRRPGLGVAGDQHRAAGRGAPERNRHVSHAVSDAPILASLELADTEISDLFGTDVRNVERDDDDGTLSFFAGASRHVVFKAKELQALRPHGHLIRSGDRLVPDEASLTSTTWMAGIFNSLVTQGHVSINRLLSTARSYLALMRAGGARS